MSLSVTISNQSVTILEPSLQVSNTLDQRSTCAFIVRDDTGTNHYQLFEPVQVVDTATTSFTNPQGIIFSGYIADVVEENKFPNSMNFCTIQCFDSHFLADKRVATKDYVNSYAGNIVADFLANYLSIEGVTSSYAYDQDSSALDFSQGTLSNTVGVANLGDGNLELAPAGTTLSILENTSTVWNAGAYTNAASSNNQLTLAPITAIKLQGTASQGVNNNYFYATIWTGSQAITTSDVLQYNIWISSSSPAAVGGVDFLCTDGTSLRSQTANDQQGLAAHPGTDLSGYATDQRYARQITIPSSLNGKTIASVQVALEGDPAGTYTLYIDTIQFVHGSAVNIFTGTLQTNQQVSNIGYSNVSLTTATIYNQTGNRYSPVYSLSSVGMPRFSSMSWVSALVPSATGVAANITTNTTGANSTPYVTVEITLDNGATWQFCTNHGSIPGLLAGANLAGRYIQFRQTLNVAGPDPTITPAIVSLQATIQPSYAYTKTDIVTSYLANWNTGTLTDTLIQSDTASSLGLNGFFRTWSDANKSSQTVFGTGTPTDSIITGQYVMTNTGSSVDVRSQLIFAGQWQNFTLEVDAYVNTFGNYGLVYRTTNWNNANNTFAYEVDMTTTTLTFGKGSNAGSTGTFTNIATATVPLTAGSWHRLKLIVSGTSHQVFIDGVRYINVTDASFSATGYIGLRYFNNSGTSHSGFFKNFGIVSNLTGTWVSASTSLSSIGTGGLSLIEWNATVPSNSTLLVETSINGGSTYQTATNGAAIPGLTNGLSLSGKNLKIRATLTANNANVTPMLSGLSCWVLGQYNASGSRITPALDLSSVGRAGNTLVAWNGNQPTNTAIAVDTSLDYNSWFTVGSGATGNAPIAQLTTQLDPVDDTFDTNTAGLYTSTSQTGGASATWTFDTTNSRVTASGGAHAFLLYGSLTARDVDMVCDMDTSDGGGLVWRASDTNNFYELSVQDDSSLTPSQMLLYRVANNVRTQIPAATISFPRGTYHRIRVTMLDATISVYFDGVLMMSGTDSAPLPAGQTGLRSDTIGGSSSAQFYQFRVQSLGQSVVGQTVYARIRLTSTDATVTPQVSDLTISAYSGAIQTGAFIPGTAYSVLNGSTNSIAQDLDDLARQSNYWWRIAPDPTNGTQTTLYFQARNGQLAPWIATPNDMRIGLGPVHLQVAAPQYRTSPWILGGTDIQFIPSETHIADGISQSWTMELPVDSVSSILVDGQPSSFGIAGVDTGKTFYYTVGNNTITQDTTQVPFVYGQRLIFAYNAQINVVANSQLPSLVKAQSTVDGTSGLIEVAETAQGLNKAAALQLSQSRLNQYGQFGRTLSFTTMRIGLQVGQLLSVFLPQHQVNDGQFLITDIGASYHLTVPNGDGVAVPTPFYTISCTEGPIVASWYSFVTGLHK